ncbi:hypothetical protein ACIP5Y_08665 [Nocardia sp. NPDC088792]|uniref:hypothetical protein n=1 Tax=Nocardia sp. NPDC088792 TaxID=3364332 RepID=UPI0037FF731E
MYADTTERCFRCGWTNLSNARRCRGCARPLARIAAFPLPASGYRRSSLIGIVTSDPQPMGMPVVQPFWFVIAAVAVVAEDIARLSHPILGATLGGVAATAALIYLFTRSGVRPLARTARRVAPIRMRKGMRLGITDDTGARWTLHFLPLFGTDLHVGDPAFAEGHENRYGEFRALTLTNIRTGTRHISRWAVSTYTTVTCAVLVVLLFVAPTG